MKKEIALGLVMCSALALPLLSWGQAPAPAPVAQPEDIEPGVDTSADRHAPAARKPTRRSAAAAGEEQAPASKEARGGTKPAAAAAGAKGRTLDRLELDSTEITGNRELPKVMVIVPWKRADLGDLAGKPMNSLIDEVLQPIDRDVFQRQTRYYDALKPDAAPSAPAPAAAPAPSGTH